MRYTFWSNRRRVVVGDAEETTNSRTGRSNLRGGGGASDAHHQKAATGEIVVTPRPPPATLDDVCSALRKQQLVELRLGWHEGPDLAKYGGGCKWLRSHRHVQQLVRALQVNKSLKHLSLGWRIRRRSWIADILDSFRVSSAMLETFQLVLHHNVQWLPEESFKTFLVNQTHLVSIDLQCVRAVLPTPATCACGQHYASLQAAPTHRSRSTRPEQHSHYPSRPSPSPGSAPAPPPLPRPQRCPRDHGVISRVIVHLFRHERLKALQLADCSVTDRQANQLADFLHIRGGLARLSLRKNSRTLSGIGIRDLCQAPVMERLDLSLCDLGTLDICAAAASIAKRPWPLRELALSGNYRVGVSGWASLASRACCDRLVSLDVSYCDIGPAKAVRLLETLERNLSATTALQQLNLQGCQLSWHHQHRRPGARHLEIEDEAATPPANGNVVPVGPRNRSAEDEDDTEEEENGGNGIAGGCRPRGIGMSQALSRLLRQNNSLRVVRLNDPSRPERASPMSVSDLARVLDALQHNYELEVLQVDNGRDRGSGRGHADRSASSSSTSSLSTSPCSPLWVQLDFVMRLNRAGRRVLLGRRQRTPHDWYGGGTCTDDDDDDDAAASAAVSSGSALRPSATGPSPPHYHPPRRSHVPLWSGPSVDDNDHDRDDDAWFQVLADAASAPHADVDVLFWLVREGTDRFGQSSTGGSGRASGRGRGRIGERLRPPRVAWQDPIPS